MPFLANFLVGRVPLLRKTTEKVGALILTSLLEDLDAIPGFVFFPVSNGEIVEAMPWSFLLKEAVSGPFC